VVLRYLLALATTSLPGCHVSLLQNCRRPKPVDKQLPSRCGLLPAFAVIYSWSFALVLAQWRPCRDAGKHNTQFGNTERGGLAFAVGHEPLSAMPSRCSSLTAIPGRPGFKPRPAPKYGLQTTYKQRIFRRQPLAHFAMASTIKPPRYHRR